VNEAHGAHLALRTVSNVMVIGTDLDRDWALGHTFLHDLFSASLLILHFRRQALGVASSRHVTGQHRGCGSMSLRAFCPCIEASGEQG
jgi:hypothetical protein